MQINLFSLMQTRQLMMPIFEAEQFGRIVLIGSRAALQGRPHQDMAPLSSGCQFGAQHGSGAGTLAGDGKYGCPWPYRDRII